MESDVLSQQVQALRRRIGNLYQASAARTSPAELLPKAFEELQYAVEQLHQVEELLRRKQRELDDARDAQEQERQVAVDTYNYVPTAYVVTGIDGTIKRVNSAGAAFFNQTEKFLLGKSLGLFIPEGERRAFRAELDHFRALSQPTEWKMRLQPHGSRPVHVSLTIGTACDRAGRVVALHWLIRKVGKRHEEEVHHLDSYASL